VDCLEPSLLRVHRSRIIRRLFSVALAIVEVWFGFATGYSASTR
jgi:hypothetical protein